MESAWPTVEGSLLDDELRQRLAAFYRASDRHYHDLSHIEAMLALAGEHADLIADPGAVEAAIWFHDAILDTRAGDNEARSARLAETWLEGRAEPRRIGSVAAMIEATASHAVPPAASPALHGDIAALLDFDLAILGAPPPAFDAYEAAVRREYDWVADDAWKAGRAAVLQRFLDRPFIYATARFRDLLEAPARSNIARSLARLGSRPR